MKIGFTGTRYGMTNKQRTSFLELIVDHILLHPINDIEFHHGDCVGSDLNAHNIVKKFKCSIHIHPPTNKSLRAFCSGDVLYTEKDYIERNHDIVNLTDILIATPNESQEVLRSGTWATIRYAKKQNKTVHIIEPSGTINQQLSSTLFSPS